MSRFKNVELESDLDSELDLESDSGYDTEH